MVVPSTDSTRHLKNTKRRRCQEAFNTTASSAKKRQSIWYLPVVLLLVMETRTNWINSDISGLELKHFGASKTNYTLFCLSMQVTWATSLSSTAGYYSLRALPGNRRSWGWQWGAFCNCGMTSVIGKWLCEMAWPNWQCWVSGWTRWS